MDDSFYSWKDVKRTPSLQAVLTTHVDDLAVVGKTEFKERLYSEMCKEFGKIAKEKLPFSHCGCRYTRTSTGLKMGQSDFASRLQPAPEPQGPDDRPLTPAEVTQLRSVIGGLMWLCSTRLDLVADTGVLQSSVPNAQVKHLRMANQAVKKFCTQDKLDLGLHFKFFEPGTKLRIQCFHDAASATKGKSYAQEGILVLLMPELCPTLLRQDEVDCSSEDAIKLCGFGHVLFAHGGKSKRVSYSTSHAETLSAVNGLEATSMVSTRLTELWIQEPAPSLKLLTEYQEGGSNLFPVDSATDCRDLFELSTGGKGIPQDRLQRLYVLAIKEARVSAGANGMDAC